MNAIHHLVVDGKPITVEGPVRYDPLRHNGTNPDCGSRMSYLMALRLRSPREASFVFLAEEGVTPYHLGRKIIGGITGCFSEKTGKFGDFPPDFTEEFRKSLGGPPDIRWLEIDTLGVKDGLDGHGLGGALMCHMIHFHTVRGLDAVLLTATNGDETLRAVKFYEGLGFQEVAALRDGQVQMILRITPEVLAELRTRREIRPMKPPRAQTKTAARLGEPPLR